MKPLAGAAPPYGAPTSPQRANGAPPYGTRVNGVPPCGAPPSPPCANGAPPYGASAIGAPLTGAPAFPPSANGASPYGARASGSTSIRRAGRCTRAVGIREAARRKAARRPRGLCSTRRNVTALAESLDERRKTDLADSARHAGTSRHAKTSMPRPRVRCTRAVTREV